MTLRERWLTFGMAVLGVLLLGLGLWQQIRYGDAENAIRQYAQLEDRVERSNRSRDEAKKAGLSPDDVDEDSADVLARQARPELRRSLTRGEFGAVLQRIAALQEESGGAGADRRGKGVSVDEIWPPRSKEREKAREVLRLLANKQDVGYDMGPAQQSLLHVAEAARSGKKTQAQALFTEVEARVKNASLRPGFQAPQAEANPGAAGQPGDGPGAGGTPPKVTEQQIQQTGQFLNVVLPQLLTRPEVTPDQRRLGQRLQTVGNEAIAAYRQGKDVSPAIALLQKSFPVMRDGDSTKAEKLLNQAQALIRAAKPLPGGKPAQGPQNPAVAGGGPQPPVGAAPALPPAAPGMPRRLSPEQVLGALDAIRKMPEDAYQKQKPQMAAMLGQMLGGGAPAPPGAGSPAGSGMGVGEAANVRLEFGPLGEVTGVAAHGRDLDGGLPAGGLALQMGEQPERALRGPVKRDGKTLVQRAAGPEGNVVATYAEEGKELVVTVRARRDREGKPGEVLLRLPIRAAGWRWDAGGDPQVMAVDGAYSARPNGDAPLAPVTLRGAGVGLRLTAPTAASVSWEPAGNYLTARLPVGGSKGVTQHVVRLSAE